VTAPRRAPNREPEVSYLRHVRGHGSLESMGSNISGMFAITGFGSSEEVGSN